MVTFGDLFTFVIMLCAVITLVWHKKQRLLIILHIIFYVFAPLCDDCVSFRFQFFFLCFYAAWVFGVQFAIGL